MGRYRKFVPKEAGRGRRRELRYWANRELGITTVEVARRLNLAQPTVSQSVDRGERIAAEKRVALLSK
jgi:putative transposase